MQVVARISGLAIGLVLVWQLGCSPPASAPPTATNSTSSSDGHGHDHPHDHGHDHGHGHDHAHGHSHAHEGPNGGHIIELGNEEYHAEWVHDNETGKLTVFILDAAAKEVFPIPAAHIKIDKKIGDKSQTYELAAVDPQGDPAKSAKFEITDKPLVEALKTAGTGVEATISVDIGEKTYTSKIEHHDH